MLQNLFKHWKPVSIIMIAIMIIIVIIIIIMMMSESPLFASDCLFS